jgi:hypothetical protein
MAGHRLVASEKGIAMNATSLEELRAGQVPELRDDKMEQVRELLFGDQVRELHARIAALEQKHTDFETAVEQKHREYQISVSRQFDAIAARIEALAGETDAERRSAFEELSRSVLDLGERIRAATTTK